MPSACSSDRNATRSFRLRPRRSTFHAITTSNWRHFCDEQALNSLHFLTGTGFCVHPCYLGKAANMPGITHTCCASLERLTSLATRTNHRVHVLKQSIAALAPGLLKFHRGRQCSSFGGPVDHFGLFGLRRQHLLNEFDR